MSKAFFFDRDGTINVERNYLYQKEYFTFLPGVPQVLKELKSRGYLLILITNQSGIARGFYTVHQMQELHQYMQSELANYNAQFDDILFCPHHPEGRVAQYAITCRCRKPGGLLFEQAIDRHRIEPGISYAVGDRERDLIPAEKLGINCIKISESGRGNDLLPDSLRSPYAVKRQTSICGPVRKKESRWITCPTMNQLMDYVCTNCSE